MTNIPDDILAKYLSGKCSDEELRELSEWISQSEENARELAALLKTSQLASSVSHKSMAEAFDRVTYRIAKWDEQKRRIRNRRIWLYVAAASIAIVAMVGTVTYFSKPVIPIVNFAATDSPRMVVLPDSTHVWLNHHSTISYPQHFADDHRDVTLIGEAYFEVTHDQSRPFKVFTSTVDVAVLGTKFSFKVGNGYEESYVSLLEGSVEVSPANGHDGVVLSPGQKAVFNPVRGALSVEYANTAIDAVWHNNLIPVERENLSGIINILEHLYSVNVHVSDEVDTTATYSGETKYYSTIDSTLTALQHALPIHFKVKNSEVWIDHD